MLWHPERIGEERIVRVRDALVAEIGPALMAVDPEHVVNEDMVDVRVEPIGTHDRLRSDLFVTLLARSEPGRVAGAAHVVARLHQTAVDAADGQDAVVELVLTDHHSSVDYAALE